MTQCATCNANDSKKCSVCKRWYCGKHFSKHDCGDSDSSTSESEFAPEDDSDDEPDRIVHQKKKRRPLKEKTVVTAADSSSEDDYDAVEEDDSDEQDGKSEKKQVKKKQSAPRDFEAEYYSSDDDETPLDAPRGTARNEFDSAIAVLRRINEMFEAYAKNHTVLQEIKLFKLQEKQKLHKFSANKLYHTIKNRDRIEQQTQGYVFHISRPAQWLALALLLRDPQYRPCDIYVELWPSVLQNLMCIRGGNSLPLMQLKTGGT